MISWLAKIYSYFLLKKSSEKRSKKRLMNNFFKNAKSFFVIMPRERYDFVFSQSIVRNLVEAGKSVTVLVLKDSEELVRQAKKVTVETYTDDDISFLKLPKLPLRQRLRILVFDVVLDLNRKEDLFSSICANTVNSITVISFAKDDSDKFYNIQFHSDEVNSEVSYKDFFQSLQMF